MAPSRATPGVCGGGGSGTSGHAWAKGAWDPCFPSTQSHEKGILMKCWGYRKASGRLTSLERWVPGPMMANRAGEGSWLPAGAGKGQAVDHELDAGPAPGGVYPCPRDAEGPWPLPALVSSFFSCRVCMWIVCVCTCTHTHTYSLSRSAFSLTKGVGDPGGMGAQSPLARQLEA